jgi:hypothetical protein
MVEPLDIGPAALDADPGGAQVGARGFGFTLAVRASIIAGIGLALSALGSVHACADDRVVPVTPAVDLGDYFANWFARVNQTQAEQPHWKAPLTTTTPLLTELVRYDQSWENLPGGARLQMFDSGKGLELIPAERMQLILALPPYEELRGPNANANGFGDWPFLLMKYRILSANEQNGDYVLTAFLQESAPTGAKRFSTNAYAIIPTIAGGIGWGNFNIQTTLSESFPTSRVSKIGDATIWNLALQAHIGEVFWPEVETNYTYFPNGPRAGKAQISITPNLIVGSIPINQRLGLNIGVGYQVAVSPRVPSFDRNWILSVRLNF